MIRNNRNQTLAKVIQITVRMSVRLADLIASGVRRQLPVVSFLLLQVRQRESEKERERERREGEENTKDVALHERP